MDSKKGGKASQGTSALHPFNQNGSEREGEVLGEVALDFVTSEDFDVALDIVFRDQLSASLVGGESGRTIIVPIKSLHLFKGLGYEKMEVLSASDLPPKEVAMLRRENLGFQK